MPAPSVVDTLGGGASGGATGTVGTITSSGDNTVGYLLFHGYDFFSILPTFLWGGQPFETLVQNPDPPGAGNNLHFILQRIIAPPAGAQDITFIDSNASAFGSVVVVAVKDADQDTPNGSVVTDFSGTSAPTVDVPADDPGGLMLCFSTNVGSIGGPSSPAVVLETASVDNLQSFIADTALVEPDTTFAQSGNNGARMAGLEVFPVAAPPGGGGGGGSIDVGSMNGFDVRFHRPRRPDRDRRPRTPRDCNLDRLLFSLSLRGGR